MITISKLICLVLFASVCSALADSSSSKLRGVVTDPEGGAIRGARILLHWDPSGSRVGLTTNVGLPEDLSTEADRRGDFSAEIPPGFYDVFVSAMGFTPDCHKIRIKPGETAIYNARLKADPLVTNELGFFIPGTK